ncbi:MAG: phosphoribosylaminoimidazolecarboxamide formyltransferase [Holdemania massiliensis]
MKKSTSVKTRSFRRLPVRTSAPAGQTACLLTAISPPCQKNDETTARFLSKEVSDGVIAPSYSEKALEILRAKRKGTYLVLRMDANYTPKAMESKEVYGVRFHQQRNDVKIDESLLQNIVSENKELPEAARRDLLIAMITAKYTQSNSVVYAKDGQAIGIGAGQQSRIHCTRMAGNKADIWHLRQHPKVLNLPFKEKIRRADRDNAIDVYISDEWEDLLREGSWQEAFTEKPEVLSAKEKKAWLASVSGVSLASDAFFPFGDNIERARKSGVSYIVEAGGSVRDDHVIDTCNRYGIVLIFNGVRLFHH